MPPDQLTVADILLTPPEYYVLAAFAFLFGLIVGSFLNVVIYRLPLGMSVNHPKRSFCFRCGTMIRWHDNIPVLSYLLLGGRCRACGVKFSARYAVVELLTGVVFLGLWLSFIAPNADGFTPLIFWYLLFAACLIIGTFTDFDHWIIPPVIPRIGTIGALAAALAAGFLDHGAVIAQGGPFPALRIEWSTYWIDRLIAVLMGPAYAEWQSPQVLWWEPLANAVIGAIVAPLFVYAVGVFGKILFRKEAMGLGDVELFVMIGAALGAVNSVLVLVVASFFGSVAGIIGILRTRVRRVESPLALGSLDDEEALRLAAPAPAPPAPEDDETARARAFAESLEMEFVDLSSANPPAEALDVLARDTARRLAVVPLAADERRVRLAVEDPLSTRLVQELREALPGREIEFVIAAPAQIRDAWERLEKGDGVAATTAAPLWKRYHDVSSRLELPPDSHHLPFIPWITLGALCVTAFQPLFKGLLRYVFIPIP